MAIKNNARTRRNAARQAQRLNKVADSFTTIDPIGAFKSGNAEQAFEAVDTLKKARTMPAQVQRDNAKAKLVLAISRQLTDKADADLKAKAEQAEQFQSDLAGAYIDAIGERKDDTMTAADLAVLCNLMGNGMTKATMQAALSTGK